MPTEPLAALFYVFFLLPGIACLYLLEKHRNIVKRSAFRESALVVTVSAISLITVGTLMLVVSYFVPSVADWMKQVVLAPAKLIRQDSQGFYLSMLGILLASVAFGFLFGSAWFALKRQKLNEWRERKKESRRQKRKDAGKTEKETIPPVRIDQSGWDVAFSENSSPKKLNVILKDDTLLQGTLRSYSAAAEDGPDRALVLHKVLMQRSSTADVPSQILEADYLVVQASEIKYLTVGYYEDEAETPE